MPTDTFNYPCWSAILSNKLPLKETCFNAGLHSQIFQVPKGWPRFPRQDNWRCGNQLRGSFSRPGGTRADADDDPALKRRAIIGMSLWDKRGRAVRAKATEGCRTPRHWRAREGRRHSRQRRGVRQPFLHLARVMLGEYTAVLPIPKGLPLEAQGCRAAATLGPHPTSQTNRNAVAALRCLQFIHEAWPQPRCGWEIRATITQG